MRNILGRLQGKEEKRILAAYNGHVFAHIRDSIARKNHLDKHPATLLQLQNIFKSHGQKPILLEKDELIYDGLSDMFTNMSLSRLVSKFRHYLDQSVELSDECVLLPKCDARSGRRNTLLHTLRTSGAYPFQFLVCPEQDERSLFSQIFVRDAALEDLE